MFRVMLVNMPFANCDRPSLGLSLLKAALLRDGVHCDIAYANLSYAKLVGHTCYRIIADFNAEALIGEWIFAAAVFGERDEEVERYLSQVIHPVANAADVDAVSKGSLSSQMQLLADFRAMRSKAAAFLDSCLNEHDWGSYDLVGFTSTFQQTLPALGLAQRVKNKFPRIAIAFGGANCEGEMGLALHRNFGFVDFVFSGEGDKSFPTLIRFLAEGTEPPPIDGLIRRTSAGTKTPDKMTDPVMDLDALPVPNFYDFFDQHAALFKAPEELLMPIESSRGCWWGQKSHCTFCGLNGGTMAFRAKSPVRFLQEVEELVRRHGVRNLAAVDNIIDMAYFDNVLPLLKEKRLDLNLMYETKANLREHQVRLLADCGVRHIQPGIESLSTNVLKLMRKGVHAYQNIRLLRWCAEYLVSPAWNLISAFPYEDPADYRTQIDIVSFITHLTPPTGVAPVRLDRFSPMFVSGEKLGVRRIRPTRAYAHVYPLPQEELEGLAYFFDFDYVPDQDPSTYVPPLRRAVDGWINGSDYGRLIALDDGTSLAVSDGRTNARSLEYELRGWQRLLYIACGDGAVLRQLEQALAKGGYDSIPVGEMQEFLSELIEARLLLKIDDRYLSLAIRGDYHFSVIAQQLSDDKDPSDVLREAAGRLFELHKTRFAEHLARHLPTVALPAYA
jgi:ribosomal peptide maturation radical SAM protein 1